MSHFLFGDYYSDFFRPENIQYIKAYFEQKGFYIWFNDEIDFYREIKIMLNENCTLKNNIAFGITTELQPTNSSDLLFPYSKYDNKILFPDGDNDRSIFNELSNTNLDVFYGLLLQFIKIMRPKGLRIFVVNGYGNNFEIKKYSCKEMVEDIKNQVRISFFLDSVIYEIVD